MKALELKNEGPVAASIYFCRDHTSPRTELPKVRAALRTYFSKMTTFHEEEAENAYEFISTRIGLWRERLKHLKALYIPYATRKSYGIILHRNNSSKGERIYFLTREVVKKGVQKVVSHCFSLMDEMSYVYGMNRDATSYGEVYREVKYLRKLKGQKRFCQMIEGFSLQSRKIVIVMEYYQNYMSLKNALRLRALTEREEKIAIVRQLLKAVDTLSRLEISHHDLTPGNVLLRFDIKKRKWKVVVIDFGHSTSIQSLSDEGTPIYLPPEGLSCSHDSAKTDVWSVCAIAWEIFSGKDKTWVEGHLYSGGDYDVFLDRMSALEKIPEPVNVHKAEASFLKQTMKVNPLERPSACRALAVLDKKKKKLSKPKRSSSFSRVSKFS